jgi:integrase
MGRGRAVRISPETRADVRSALTLLGGRKLSLTDCVRMALHLDMGTGDAVSTPLSKAVPEFLAWSIRQKVRRKTAQFYEDQLEAFGRAFPDATLDDFSRAELKTYLEGLLLAPASIEARWRAVRRLFRWAIGRNPPLVRRDPTAGLELELPHRERTIGFLTVDECEHALKGVLPKYRAPLALMLFAGVRPEELHGDGKPPMDWRHVDVAGKRVTVPAECTKVRNAARILDGLPRNLWTWLPAPAPESGAILAQDSQTLRVHVKTILGFVERAEGIRTAEAGRRWPHDAFRHTFATYHLAHYNDPGRTGRLLGHRGSTELLHARYAASTALAADGAKFFALRPTSPSQSG